MHIIRIALAVAFAASAGPIGLAQDASKKAGPGKQKLTQGQAIDKCREELGTRAPNAMASRACVGRKMRGE